MKTAKLGSVVVTIILRESFVDETDSIWLDTAPSCAFFLSYMDTQLTNSRRHTMLPTAVQTIICRELGLADFNSISTTQRDAIITLVSIRVLHTRKCLWQQRQLAKWPGNWRQMLSLSTGVALEERAAGRDVV